MTTLDALYHDLHEMGTHSSEYWAKMMHAVPKADVVDRVEYLQGFCKEKVILHIGCTGHLDAKLKKVATRVYGIDRCERDREDYAQCDLDDLGGETSLPQFDGVEVIVCGEVLEHLANPGWFLAALRHQYPQTPIVFTVPNAFCLSSFDMLRRHGRENVNRDHVAYYTYTTLSTLLTRYSYTVKSFHWYHGKPYTAEGLVMVVQ